MKPLLLIENIAVRIMYFLNVTDSFLPFSVACYFSVLLHGTFRHGLLALTPASCAIAGLSFLFVYLCCVIADFHCYFLCSVPALLVLWVWSGQTFAAIGAALLWMFIFTSAAQIVGMGLPNAVASRDARVPLRMYLNSFVILAPTTISLPVTLAFQLIMIESIRTAVRRPASLPVAGAFVVLLVSSIVTRIIIRRPDLPPPHHPRPSKPLYRRVILLNIDGLSFSAYRKAHTPFVHHCAEEFASTKTGVQTVYKAFTNPAFASILTGTTPDKHHVYNNNFGQSIGTQALPDIIPSRLYGSMHVKHFSKPSWNVSIVSLVELGYDKADAALMERVRTDLLNHRNDVALWIVDLSLADYCGHAWGSYSKKYYSAITAIDDLIEDFFKWCGTNGFLDDTLFVISSDHGNFIAEHAYMLSDKERLVPLIFAGSTIGCHDLNTDASIIDIAANISYALDSPYCAGSAGRVFDSMHSYVDSKTFASRLAVS
jgi:hypothetical protein